MPETTNVVKFYHKNAAKNPDLVLEQAIGEYEDVLIIGFNKDGGLEVRSNYGLKSKDALWLIESFKMELICGAYEEEEGR